MKIAHNSFVKNINEKYTITKEITLPTIQSIVHLIREPAISALHDACSDVNKILNHNKTFKTQAPRTRT